MNDTFSDEYNLTEKEVNALASESVVDIVKNILDAMFSGDKLVSLEDINNDRQFKLSLYKHFEELYSFHLKRELCRGEQAVLNTAIKIIPNCTKKCHTPLYTEKSILSTFLFVF